MMILVYALLIVNECSEVTCVVFVEFYALQSCEDDLCQIEISLPKQIQRGHAFLEIKYDLKQGTNEGI